MMKLWLEEKVTCPSSQDYQVAELRSSSSLSTEELSEITRQAPNKLQQPDQETPNNQTQNEITRPK